MHVAALAAELNLWVVVCGNLARAPAAAKGFWIRFSVPAPYSHAMPAGVIGPHGFRLASADTNGQPTVVCVDLDRTDPPSGELGPGDWVPSDDRCIKSTE